MKALFYKYEGPTWLVALALYGGWALLLAFQADLSWWIITPVGATLVAWHFSLQHEAIHSFRSAPTWLRTAVVMPPLGLWLPFPLYRAAHARHHQNTHLTEPGVDTESVYWRAADWAALPRRRRTLLLFNQTLTGRVLAGPPLRLEKLVRREFARVAAGDFSHLGHWAVHGVLVALLFGYISGVCGMPWWQYVIGIAWPAFGLGWVRSFIEHRHGARPAERTAIVESNLFWGLLFLNNNLHAVHHLYPRMRWWEIPAYFHANRERILARNGRFYFRGYFEIARRWALRPVFTPVHPRF